MTPELRYLLAVYEEGSFSRAAEKLFITQPALSIAIRKLEEEAGMPLIDRKQRPLRLTAAGNIYIDSIRKQQYIELERKQRLDDIRNLNTGLIRIGGSHYLNAYILPPYLVRFAKSYPSVRLHILERSSHELAAMLSSHEIDMTFTCDPGLTEEYPSYEMFDDNIILAVPSDDPFNEKHLEAMLSADDILSGRHLSPSCPRLSIRDIGDEGIILLREGNNLRERVLEMYREAGMEVRVLLDLNQLVTAFHLAEAGLGATFTSDRLIRSREHGISFYALDSPLSRRTFSIILSKDSYTPLAVKKLVEVMMKHGRG